MKEIFDLVGEVVNFANSPRYYVLDCKKIGSQYFCFGIALGKDVLGNCEQIIEVWLKDGKILAALYKGENYQSIMDEFTEPDNLLQCLQFMLIQREVLLKESKEKEAPVLPEENAQKPAEPVKSVSSSPMEAFEKLAALAASHLKRKEEQESKGDVPVQDTPENM